MAEDAEASHSHCWQCHNSKCLMPDNPPISCEVTACELNCGAVFHSCKQSEHRLVCSQQRVPCINKEFGCPINMPRWRLGSHLSSCPGSVVHCAVEWNRWPVYCKERQAKVPFVQNSFHARYGQLDVALAFRDQRMLKQAMKAPRRTRRVLRNSLTRRFPAVPFQYTNPSDHESTDVSHTTSDDGDPDAPWEIAKNPPGLQRSMCNELFSASKRTADSLTGMLNTVTVSDKDKNQYVCHPLKVDVDENNHTSGPLSMPSSGGSLADVSSLERSTTQSPVEFSPRAHGDGADKELTLQEVKELDDESEQDPKCAIPEPPQTVLKELLGLEINIESITKYQPKPVCMYTFLCAQDLRRDEYAWHFKNVHNDIMTGLVEQRCPLAVYGCTYSIRRMHPNNKGSDVIYNELIEGYGVKPSVPEEHTQSLPKSTCYQAVDTSCASSKEPTPELYTSKDYNSVVIMADGKKHESHKNTSREDYLSNLPDEVILYIFQFLDSFSMFNLALCNCRLRALCCSLLEEKGIVLLDWEKIITEDRPKWRIGFKRWRFSQGFSPVRQWGFNDYSVMGDHLRTCPFNKREPYQDKPWELRGMLYTLTEDYKAQRQEQKASQARRNSRFANSYAAETWFDPII